MNKDVLRQGVNLAALILTLVVNGLANALPLNGQTSAEIANRIPILFVPANYVFSIWGVIYLFLIGFGIYQALPSQRENPILRRIGYLFVVSCIGNAGWLFSFHYEQFPLSMILMIIVLLSLIAIYIRTGIGRLNVSRADKWLIHIPFSIYLGWITVATIANASYVLYVAEWDRFGIPDEIWTVTMLIVATIIVLLLIFRHSDIAYTAVIVWALVGIVVKQSDIQSVALTAAAMTVIVILALLATRSVLRDRIPQQQKLDWSPA